MECPLCGMEREEDDAIYICTECGAEGCDCCVPGNNAICGACEGESADEEDAERNAH